MVSSQDGDVIAQYMRAMQGGPECEEDLLAMFTEDAVYIEPYAGEPQTHDGKPAIKAWVQAQSQMRPPDLTISVDRLDVEQGQVRADWTCRSSVFPGPMRGYDVYSIRDGRIARLETRMIDTPPGPPVS